MEVHCFIIRLGVLLLFLISNCLGYIRTFSVYNRKTIIQWSFGSSRQFTVKKGGDDVLAFFGSDNDRALEYVCANTTALCRMHISKNQPDSTKDEVVFTAQVDDMMLPVVSMSGILQLCIGPSHLFRKRPLVQDGDLSCHVWHKEKDPSLGGYQLYPNHEVQDSAVLAVYTWYMTVDNYQEMRKNDITQVFVPLFKDTYKLPIYTIVFSPYSNVVQCQLQSPSDQEPDQDVKKRQVSEDLGPHTFKFTDYITSANSGVCNVTCSIQHDLKLSKLLNITFISGPVIVVQDSDNNRVVFSPQDTTGSFEVTIYTTTPVTSFLVERSDGVSSSEQILSEQVSYSPYGIVAVFSVRMPWLKDEMSGVYTMFVTNKDKESVTQNIEILKAKVLQVLVSPKHQTAAEGTRVSFECLVQGNLIEELKWTRDFEHLDQRKNAVEIKLFRGKDTSGLRLTFLNPRLEDSGHYVCIASNRFEKHRVNVELSVWPVGSPYLQGWDTHTPSSHYRKGATVLNTSDDDLLKEWSRMDVMITSDDDISRSGESSAAIVVVVLTVLILLATIVTIGVVVAVMYCKVNPMKWMRSKLTSDSDHSKLNTAAAGLEEREPMIRPAPEKTPTNNMEEYTPGKDSDLLNLCNEPVDGTREEAELPLETNSERLLELNEEELQDDPLVHLGGHYSGEDDNQMVGLGESEDEVDETVPLLVETTEKDTKVKKRKKKMSTTEDKTNASVTSRGEKSTAEHSSKKKKKKSRKDKDEVKSKRKERDDKKSSTRRKRDKTPSTPEKQ